MSWQERAAAKRAARDALIPHDWLITVPADQLDVRTLPETCGLLNARELEITGSDVSTLLASIARSHYSAAEVCVAFSKRAAVAQQAVNCLTEILFDKALEQAKALDEHLARTGQVVGPLHGLPVSLKDQCQIEGEECSMGFVAWLGERSKEDAVVVKMLRKAGAVFHCRTNVPQTLMRGARAHRSLLTVRRDEQRDLRPDGQPGESQLDVGRQQRRRGRADRDAGLVARRRLGHRRLGSHSSVLRSSGTADTSSRGVQRSLRHARNDAPHSVCVLTP